MLSALQRRPLGRGLERLPIGNLESEPHSLLDHSSVRLRRRLRCCRLLVCHGLFLIN